MNSKIDIFGARVHNLKGIDLSIPRQKLVVITGLSGSGKSSLAFDTIYVRGRDDTWRLCRPMHVSLSAQWRDPMSIR